MSENLLSDPKHWISAGHKHKPANPKLVLLHGLKAVADGYFKPETKFKEKVKPWLLF
jgi:hypothetical protein